MGNMSARWQLPKVAFFLGVVILIGLYFLRMNTPLERQAPEVGWRTRAEKYKSQRNKLAAILNSVKQQLAVMSCDIIDLKRELGQKREDVSISGGWCKKDSYSSGGKHVIDRDLALQLSYLFENQTVASFGDGPGDYKRFLDKTKRLRLYDAYDGAPYGPDTSGGVVRFLDLSVPQYGLPVYDWVLSLEVAEHIPTAYESVFVDNVVRHARKGVVLSWGRPDQDGFSHVNLRPLNYVKTILARQGFEVDDVSSKTLQEYATYHWLVHNVHVYRRRKDSLFLTEDV